MAAARAAAADADQRADRDREKLTETLRQLTDSEGHNSKLDEVINRLASRSLTVDGHMAIHPKPWPAVGGSVTSRRDSEEAVFSADGNAVVGGRIGGVRSVRRRAGPSSLASSRKAAVYKGARRGDVAS